MPTHARDSARLLSTIQRLMEIPGVDLKSTLTHAANALADACGADKVDAFLYDEARDSLVAMGTSTQPLSSLQKRLGLDVLPLSNGGTVVRVFQTGEVSRTGNLLADPEELRGIKEGLKIQSQLGIPLRVGGKVRGAAMIAALRPDHFNENDEAFAVSVVHWVGVLAHRAELIQAVEHNALEQGRRAAADELITVLAHDLRNHLAPVSGRLFMLRHRAGQAGRSEDLADIGAAMRGIGRATSLITDLLDVARIDQGLFQLDLEPVDIVALVREAAGILATADHEIVVAPSEPVVAMGDARRLRQCLENLLSNAVTHSPANAPVNVFVAQVKKDGESWGKVEIVDVGPGIPDALLPTIFERFVTGRGQAGGLGLGLYLARRIATAHGGDVTASRRDTGGTCFAFTIPLYAEAGAD